MKKSMTKHLRLSAPLTAVAALLLTACAADTVVHEPTLAAAQPASPALKLRSAQVLATVNGQSIAKSALAQAEHAPESPEAEARMVDELIARELIAQEFVGSDYSKDPAIMEKLANLQRINYSQLASERYLKSIVVTDNDTRKLYEQKKSELAAQQFKIRHILVSDQNTANEVIAQLNKGAKFDKLVKKYSTDEGSKGKGGDLGWIDPRSMGNGFGQVLSSMKNGDVAGQAVQSQFGWHVISREDARVQAAPSYESIKDKLVAAVRMEKFQQHILDLKAKASISTNLASEAPAPTVKK
jgi:peptidyl-prolyl cis-trans isomerase C